MDKHMLNFEKSQDAIEEGYYTEQHERDAERLTPSLEQQVLAI